MLKVVKSVTQLYHAVHHFISRRLVIEGCIGRGGEQHNQTNGQQQHGQHQKGQINGTPGHLLFPCQVAD